MGSDGVTPPLLITEPNTTMMRVKGELKKQLWLSAPLIGVSLLQYSLQVISVMFVGHLGSLPLSAASIATSFASVTGFTFLAKGKFEKSMVADNDSGESVASGVHTSSGMFLSKRQMSFAER